MTKKTRRRYSDKFKAEAVNMVRGEDYAISEAARRLDIGRSLLDRWYRQQRDREVKDIHDQKRGSYGSRRMAKELHRRGHAVGRYQARSLMQEADIACRQRRRYRHTTDSDYGLPVAPNLLSRQFTVPEPNQAWMADITAIWTLEGWLYLAAVLDLYDRQVIGWAMADHMKTSLTLDALEMAIGRRRPPRGELHHSDRGSQYASHAYRERLVQHGFLASMSRKGSCWDNALMERFFGALKSEWLWAAVRDPPVSETRRRDLYQNGVQQLPAALNSWLPSAKGNRKKSPKQLNKSVRYDLTRTPE